MLESPSGLPAVIFAVPSPTAVTRPQESTVATEVGSALQVRVRFETEEENTGSTVLLSPISISQFSGTTSRRALLFFVNAAEALTSVLATSASTRTSDSNFFIFFPFPLNTQQRIFYVSIIAQAPFSSQWRNCEYFEC